VIVGGGTFPIDKIKTEPFWAARNNDIIRSVRYWDKAGTETETAAYTAGVLMHKMKDGRFVVSHVIRGKWLANERERHIKYWAGKDHERYGSVDIGIEQEPGSGGKESAERTIANLAGFVCYADRVTGSKEIRAEPFAAQVQNGNVSLVVGDWHYEYLDELESFPSGKWKDQVDASSGAFMRLTGTPGATWDMPWLDDAR
jgi:predicted phage terminase large subunit-like protein